MRMLRAAARLGAAVGVLFPWAAPLGAQGATRDAENAVPVVAEQRGASPTVTLALHEVPLRVALKEVEAQSGVSLVYASSVVPLERLVSARVRDVPVEEALGVLLRGTVVDVRASASGQVMLVRRPEPAAEAGEARAVAVRTVVSGRVTDSATGVPVARAVVTVDGLPVRATTSDAGVYRLADVPAGPRVVRVRRIGYLPMERRVTIADGAEVRLDFALQAAPSQLDEVVVTGTATPTAVKAVPTPISVVTARDLEQAGVARVDDVLRGMVPGAVKMGTGVRDGYPGIAFRGAVSFDGLGEMPVKVYVDGVPMAYPHAMSQLDPSIIERVEITRGPQASTIYGAGAVAGVIQIFTKKGSTANGRPQISVQVAAGGLESEWRDKSTVHQDHSLAVIGGTDALSYNVSAGYESLGPWVPEYESERMSYFGAVRSTQGPASVELTASYSDRVYNFPSVDPIYREQIRSGNWRTPNDPFYSMPWNPDERRTNGTLGLNAAYSPKAWWQHRFTVGFDRYTNPRAQSAPRQLTPADTLRTYSEYASSTTTLAYNTTISAPLTESLASTFTLGLDRWSTREGGLSGTRHSDGSFAAGRSNVTKREHGNSGLFAQAQLGLADALFLTAGVRADWSDNFGADFGAAIAPRVGLAYTRDLGPVLLKSRVAYGEAIRAPLPHQKQASRINLPTSESLGNPDLGPESQRGYDAGLELFAGPRTTLRVTYYLQEVENLIGSITLTQPGEIPQRFRSENIGGIENSGWEFEGSTGRGPITVAGTYSIYNSTAEKLAPAALGDGRGQYHVGDRILRIPRSMGGLSLRYDRGGTHVTTDATYVGSFRNYDFIRYNNDRFANPPIAQPARGYLIDYPAHTKWNASFTRALTAQLSAFVRVNNIANSFAPEMDNLTPAHGRLTMIGLKAQP